VYCNMVAAIENGGAASSEDSPILLLENDRVDSKMKDTTEKKLVISTTPQDLSTNSTQTATSTLKEIPTNINNNSSGSDELTFLIEVVKATIPLPFQSSKKKNNNTSSSSSNRGIHCTTSWIGPINPSGYKRRCKFVHRTKTLKSSGKQDTASSSSNVDTEDDDIDDEDEEVDCTEYIFTVNDSSLVDRRHNTWQHDETSIVENLPTLSQVPSIPLTETSFHSVFPSVIAM